jgi:hypothetical protein
MNKKKPIPPCDRNYKMVLKSGPATMIIAKNMTYTGVLYLSKFIKNYLQEHGTKLEGDFLKPLK